ncbi:MAG: hypothetical protein ACPG9H_05515, partial [Candidatus Puniceispirillaceae bacterium]
MSVLGSLKVILALMCWALSLPLILSLTDIGAVADTALIIFIGILLLSAMRLRLQSVIILLALLLIGWFILPALPSVDQLRNAGAFVLIFACLLPTLTLVRATALTMPSVMETQRQLGQLPAKTSASGLQLASHVLGGVMNIGAFALIAASLPQKAGPERRRVAAEAALRGMNGAVLWSPFFISFAVANIYLPSGISFGAIMLGLVTAVLFFLVTSALAAPAGARFSVLDAMQPLRPIIPRLLIAVSAVILLSVATGFTALLAVVTTMPILCVIQMCRRPQTARQIAQTFWYLQKGSGDELVIISTSMVIASLAADTTSLSVMLDGLFGKAPAIWLMIWGLPVLVWLASVLGVHPVISAAPLLAYFAPSLTVFDAIFVMQAHMIGWAAGTMTSFSSLSVVLVGELFRLPTSVLSA